MKKSNLCGNLERIKHYSMYLEFRGKKYYSFKLKYMLWK